jgi:hypothetical protein
MSIIYTSGGAASIADATTTISGKVRLATIAEAGGSSEAIAVTPAGLQAEISGLVSGITYRGQIAVADFGTTLANASQGDYYKISVGGTSGGVVYDVNDSIIVNADMGGTFADAKLDRLDNVDSEVVDDLTPQLGGDLDVNGHTITSAVGDIVIDPAGAGEITVGADVIPDADATHSLGAEAERFATAWANLNGAVQFKASNASGGPISKGDALYIAGVSGSVPTVGLAQANSSLRMPAFGLAGHDANSGAEVQVITFGNLEGYNTTTLSLSRGDTLYISATNAGEVTNTPPTGEGNFVQNIGRVVRAHVDSGILKVGGAGRSNATPNLNNGNIFIGNASNQSTSAALSSVAVTSLNGSAGAVVLSANDLAADHVASNYTAANANIDGHLSGIDSEIATLAPLASPALTGTPTAPTAAGGTNTTQLATTAFVTSAVSGVSAPVDSVNGATGVVVLSANDLAADHSETNYTAANANIDGHLSGIDTEIATLAPLASPALTGTPTAPTAASGTNTTQLATTAFVTSAVSGAGGGGSRTSPASITATTTLSAPSASTLEEIYYIDSANAVTVTLVAASSVDGFKYNLKRLGTGSVTVALNGSDVIDHSGQTTFSLANQYDSITVVSDGSNNRWLII